MRWIRWSRLRLERCLYLALLLSGNGRELPAQTRGTVVVLGSSTAQGLGATKYAASWVGLLTAALQPRGYVVQNVSISGTGTAESLARFNRDVTPFLPKFVILATSIINEPVTAPATTYLQNTKVLIRKVEAIGAIPVLVAPYPNDSFTSGMYASVREIYAALGAEGVPLLDFLDGADDGQGHWVKGLTVDGTHPSDVGHKLLFDAIPITMFDALLQPEAAPALHGFGSWIQNSSAVNDGLLQVAPPTATTSWTASLWFKASAVGGDRAMLAINGDWFVVTRSGGELRVSNQGSQLGAFQWFGGQVFHHLAVTHQSITGELRVYLDGDLEIRAVLPQSPMAAVFTIGSSAAGLAWNATGDEFSDFLLYRAPLASADIQSIGHGRVPWKSVEAWLPFTYSPARSNLNIAPSATAVTVRGDWTWTSDGISPALPGRPRRTR